VLLFFFNIKFATFSGFFIFALDISGNVMYIAVVFLKEERQNG